MKSLSILTLVFITLTLSNPHRQVLFCTIRSSLARFPNLATYLLFAGGVLRRTRPNAICIPNRTGVRRKHCRRGFQLRLRKMQVNQGISVILKIFESHKSRFRRVSTQFSVFSAQLRSAFRWRGFMKFKYLNR